jgi:hypothetical protein
LTVRITVIRAKGRVRETRVMNAAKRTTPADRNRAVARLRRLTIGTTIAGLAAVGGFGTLAAVSYSGHSTGTTADVQATTTTDGTSTGSSTTTGSGTTGTMATPTATVAATATPTIQPATTTITTTTGGGQVSSGGS